MVSVKIWCFLQFESRETSSGKLFPELVVRNTCSWLEMTIQTLIGQVDIEIVNDDVATSIQRNKSSQNITIFPRPNGSVERDIRTVVELARSLIFSKFLTLNYRVEVVYTLTINIRSSGKKKTLYEIWQKNVRNWAVNQGFLNSRKSKLTEIFNDIKE